MFSTTYSAFKPQIYKLTQTLHREINIYVAVKSEAIFQKATFLAFAGRVSHYMVADYSMACSYARYLAHLEIQQLLQENLTEVKEATAFIDTLSSPYANRCTEINLY